MVALAIIYNHRYDKNIPIIEDIYKDRFSHIFHIVPFYDGDRDNVITVYENSYYFQGYIAQAYQILKNKGHFEHFFFIGDDLLLNPKVNENNYKSHLTLDNSSSFFSGYIELSKREDRWARLYDAFNYKLPINGLEIDKEIPSYNDALERFKEKQLEHPFLKSSSIYELPKRSHYGRGIRGFYQYLKRKKEIKLLLQNKKINLAYPLVGGYADIVVISNLDMKLFAHYCGIFSASKLFVELAIPTAMVLACKSIKTEKEISKKGSTFWSSEETRAFVDKYKNSTQYLLTNFPDETLYFHPVKLSKWNK